MKKKHSLPAPIKAPEPPRITPQEQSLAAVIGELVHEIRNPLSTLSMNISLLEEELEDVDTPRDKRMLKRIQTLKQVCGQLEHYLNDFLQYSRMTELTTHEVNLNKAIKDFLDFYAPTAANHHIETISHLDQDIPSVRLDRLMFARVLQNLIQNAQQAMPDGGTVEFQTFMRDGKVCFSVTDHGHGMEEHVRQRIFEPFFSTKPGGSGLGLPVVRKIILAHQGEITCKSAPHHGTQFLIELPAVLENKS